MKKYNISVPFTGYFNVTIDADNEEDAIEKAFECEPFNDSSKDGSYVEELQYHREVNRGNCTSVTLNEIDIEEVEQ